MSRLRIVLAGGFLAGYREGGGHWMVFLQYLLGLRALGHDVWWLELLRSTGDRDHDRRFVDTFFVRMAQYGLRDRCMLLLHPREDPSPTFMTADAYGLTRERIEEIARTCDVLWNFACAVRPPLSDAFAHRVLVDLDPGHLHISALTWDLGIHAHHRFLTVGGKIPDRDSVVPTLGVEWRPFTPFVYLPLWNVDPDPGPASPFTSVTQWTWEELVFGDRILSVSKRDAYLRYVEMPRRARRAFELAANIQRDDYAGDGDRFRAHGWRVVDPHQVAGSPADYQRYVARSRAEFGCGKPIHAALKTGWFSDRSACYLAAGRPVLLEETGFSERLPTGTGLLSFRDLDEALAGAAAIDADWARHSRAARAIAEDHLDSGRCLQAMLAASV